MQRFAVPAILIAGFLTVAILPAADPPITYPMTKRTDHTDTFHGTKVADPYRWLEDDVRKSPEVRRLGRGREQGHRRVPPDHPGARRHPQAPHRPVELREVQRPVQGRRPVLLQQNDGLQNQAVLYTRTTSNRPGRVLLDPNTLDQGRHRRPSAAGRQRRRQVSRLRALRGRLRLEDLARPRHRHRASRSPTN